jgi:predicted RNase H-like nuclease (RuvC/YqgF family)
MGKFLVILSIVLTAASAVLGYLNQGKLAEARKSLVDSEIAANQAKTQLAKAQSDLKTAAQDLAKTAGEKDQLASKLSGTQSELEKTKGQVTALGTDKSSLEAQVTQLTNDLQAKTQELEQKGIAGLSTQAQPTSDQEAQLAEQQTLITKLQGDLDSARSQLSTLTKEKQDRVHQRMRNGLSGRILAVNPAWNFVVLSLGDKNGVVNNAELLVKRGTQLIGKVRVTSVEPSTSIADIVANSVPQGATISPGDDVIYQSVKE